MDSHFVVTRSLPPLVEGKIHGYLKCIIDEVIWTKRSPGSVSIIVSWWGELDNAVFRPVDGKTGNIKSNKDITETYAIKTNLELFKEYLKNSETVELAIVSDKSHQVIGKVNITNLLEIFTIKSYSQYFPIYNEHGFRIGDVHVILKLMNIQRDTENPVKKCEIFRNKEINPRRLLKELPTTHPSVFFSDTKFNMKDPTIYDHVPLDDKKIEQNENIYQSALNDRRSNFYNAASKLNSGVTDKLVAQVVARAKKLRGEISNDSTDNDLLMFNENSPLDSFRSGGSAENEAALYEYFMGNQMSRQNEKKALETLRSHSPTPSLIDFAAETIRSCNKNTPESPVESINPKSDNPIEDLSDDPLISTNRFNIKRKIATPRDYVDSLRVVVDSLTLNSAGYRRVKSSCLTRGDGIPISVTYFVQYDTVFGNIKKLNKKAINGSKPVKMCSKNQDGQIIYFNHEAVYDLPKTYLNMDIPLKFKIFNRHLNQRTPTELGIGSIYVSDAAKSPHLSTTQRLAIIKKDIKIGELKVTIELGCDKIHFGKQFVEAITSTKENIPVLELSTNSGNILNRYKSAPSGEESTTNSRTTSAPDKPDNTWSTKNCSTTERKINEQKQRNDGRIIKIGIPHYPEDKTLLHALIYIGEGKNLPVSSTYLISRAFWREDRAFSRICTGTNNPFYHFHQLIPLIHDQELLNRTKDNCIIIEVYATNPTSNDNLLGIVKLSVHQLYIAYRDPNVLPHLLKSKYPVTSVDGWVPITDPVTGANYGELSALVALGTADQIALLEMTRGLRDSLVTPQTSKIDTKYIANDNKNSVANCNERINRAAAFTDRRTEEIINSHGDVNNSNNSELPNMKSQECQTEISTDDDLKPQRLDEFTVQRDENTVLHAIVDRLAQALHVPKTISDQGAQTEFEFPTRDTQEKINKVHIIEPLCLDASNSNSFSSDSYDNSPHENFNMSREIFRSVGVGAEFDEPITQASNTNYNTTPNNSNDAEPFFTVQSDDPTKHFDDVNRRDSLNSDRNPQLLPINHQSIDMDINSDEEAAFRAIVEIECALHLPKIEKSDEIIEPSTYVTFQKIRTSSTDRISAYMMTNICPNSCNPKYDWRCDTKLSTDLLVKEEKRLIMKVWRVIEPDVKLEINLEKDVVIGFSAIDLSVLTAGFPIVSGWFHIIDFSGKCNGQLKVCVTPLESLATFGKFNSAASQTKIAPVSHSNNSSPYPEYVHKTNEKQDNIITSEDKSEEKTIEEQQIEIEPMMDMGLGLGDASMSFLSLSLKQKLSELDEIKNRLQSRLQDVTSSPIHDNFVDYLDNDYDLLEHDYENDNNDKNGNTGDDNVIKTMSWVQQPTDRNLTLNRSTNVNNCFNNEQRYLSQGCSNNKAMTVETVTTDTGYSTSSNTRSEQFLMNGVHYENNSTDNKKNNTKPSEAIGNGVNNDFRFELNRDVNGHSNPYDSRNSRTNICNYQSEELKTRQKQHSNLVLTTTDNPYTNENAPTQGTRVHINHLLDKLSTQLTTAPPPITNLPMKRNIMDLLSSLRRNNNNFSNDIKCNREANVRTVPTQTDVNYVNDSLSQNNSIEQINDPPLHNGQLNNDDSEVPAKSQKRDKISTVIREELINDDHNDTIDYDYLSTRLMTSNIRHMGSDSSFNPFLSPHIFPEISISDHESQNNGQQNSTSPSVSPEGEVIEQLDNRYIETFNATINKGLNRLRDIPDMESTSSRIPSALDNAQTFRVTPTGVSENVDGNIDVTVIHKPYNDDLMASNSIESTTTISIDNDMQITSEIDDNSSLNSSNSSVSAVSRQAPDGGNPAEDPGKLFTIKNKNHSSNSPSSNS
ncbi:hypothetical protein PV326_008506 [Microctonus aethiopoides]|nr:hypothetical protein PV326_008506 [Microctonus aethiopoides]